MNKAQSELLWLKTVAQAFKLKSNEDIYAKLQCETRDGINFKSISSIKDIIPNIEAKNWRKQKDWSVLTRIDHYQISDAVSQLQVDLDNGADGAVIVFKDSIGAYGFGLSGNIKIIFKNVLDYLNFDENIIHFEGLIPKYLPIWIEACQKYYTTPLKPKISLGLSSFQFPSSNTLLQNLDSMLINQVLNYCSTLLRADGRLWHNAGATAAQELSLTVSELIYYLRYLIQNNISSASSYIDTVLCADVDQLETIAKFRALRILWSYILEKSHFPVNSLNLRAETSWRIMSRRDPWVNILRATQASFAAGVSGADSQTVLPFTQALGLPDSFSRRIARNTGLILQHESHLHQVIDPTAGAALFDQLTQNLANKAWEYFQQIEALGGLPKALEAKLPQSWIKSSLEKRQNDVKNRKITYLGNSHFAKLDEAPVNTLHPKPLEENDREQVFQPKRDSSLFEQLHDRALNLGFNIENPQITLICLGTLAQNKQHIVFAKDIFAAGGLEVRHITNTNHNLVHMFKEYGINPTPVVCLCGDEKVYDTYASKIADKVRELGAHYILLMGRASYPGIDEHITSESNIWQILDNILTILERQT